MSTTEQRRKAKRLEVPNLEENPAERKRVLNVLAQRRYRRRKKEHVQRLEQLTHRTPSDSADPQFVENVNQVDFPPTQMLYFDQFPNQPSSDVYAEDQQASIGALGVPHDLEESFGFDAATLEAFDTSLNFPSPPMTITTPTSLTTTTPISQNAMIHASGSQSTNFDKNLDFSDETYLPMLELKLLRGAIEIAKRLEVDSIIWMLEAKSPFHNAAASMYSHLPVNLRPTTVQLRTPHHPVFDILPWPSVRDRLILVFSQPEDFRPPSARGPTALIDFVYDLEDSAEGVRIWGEDPCSDKNWEVGEKLFKNWWWAMDGRVISRSNQLRCDRGASNLGTRREVEEVE